MPDFARTCRGSSRLAAISTSMLTVSTTTVTTSADADQHRIVAVDDADQHQRADAGQPEYVLDDDDAAEQEAELDGADGQIGDGRVAQRVPDGSPSRPGALGTGGANVVGGQHLDHRGAHDTQQQVPRRRRRATAPAGSSGSGSSRDRSGKA